MTDYQRDIRRHMEQYKLERLGVTENGIWKRNGKEYPHILPGALLKLNILETYRKEFWTYFDRRDPQVKLHHDFHHQNSSQAMCFNLFFPFLNDALLGIPCLVSTLGLVDGEAESVIFEFVPVPSEGTNFDFFIRFRSQSKSYFELKLSEEGFGSAQDDDHHNKKFENIYKSRVADRFLPEFCVAGQFFRNYQVMRNIWHIDLNAADLLFFILPRRNTLLEEAAKQIHNCVQEHYRDHIRVVYLEDLVSEIEKKVRDGQDRLVTHFSLLREKHLI
jgi:hypothetical protein